eukprot:TRINITY_DN5416_c4_g1_i1.p1 TRINITY_DN5416_c4_g1~~TRINITY_DN5416_c4_g1_i1.p1  ORF type:complete len:339 (+),score=93.56 TRINITY_DN5416_c4_g1_i1:81-1019(+)
MPRPVRQQPQGNSHCVRFVPKKVAMEKTEDRVNKNSKSDASLSRKDPAAIFKYEKGALLELKKLSLRSGGKPPRLPAAVKARDMEKPRLSWQPIEGRVRGDGQPALVQQAVVPPVVIGPVTPTFETGEVFDELITMLDLNEETKRESTPSKPPPPPLEPLDEEAPQTAQQPPQLLPTVPSGLKTPQQNEPAGASPSPMQRSPASSLGYNTASLTPPPVECGMPLSSAPLTHNVMRGAQSPQQVAPLSMQMDRQAAIMQLQQLRIQQQQLLQAQSEIRKQMYVAQMAQTTGLPHSPAMHMSLLQQQQQMMGMM